MQTAIYYGAYSSFRVGSGFRRAPHSYATCARRARTMSPPDRLSEEAARWVWRRAAQLQAEAERRWEESHRLPSPTAADDLGSDGLPPEEVRAAAEEAGISPEFVQIALAEAASATRPTAQMGQRDLLGARVFLGTTQRSIEVATRVQGGVEVVSAAVLQSFSGHPCLLHAEEVVDLPQAAGRVIVFKVPKFDWGATANPPFVEKAAAIGLKQLHVAVRPLQGEEASCEVVVAADLEPGLRKHWRWSAASSLGAAAAGGAAGVGLAATMVAGAILIVPGIVGGLLLSGASLGFWGVGHRLYRQAVEESLKESLQRLPAAIRADAATRRPQLPSS